MATIIPFPGTPRPPVPNVRGPSGKSADQPPATNRRGVFSILAASLWVLIILFFPLIKVIAGIDLFILGVRAIYFWKTPSAHAGFVFFLHASGYLTLVIFMFFYDHKKFDHASCDRDSSRNRTKTKTL